jgi:DNA polymerase I-like protein with 3'-5' exonuclease and polymerase domains
MDLDLVRTKLPQHVVNPDPEIYRSGNYLTVDFETTVYNRGLGLYPENSLVLAVWSLGPAHPAYTDGTQHVSWENEYGLADLVEHCQQADFIIAHNAKFELQWLTRCGLDITEVIVWDTMIAEYVIGGNRWQWAQLSLENCGKRHFGEGKLNIISKMFKSGQCSTEIPESWLLTYCRLDVSLTERLYHSQMALMKGTRLLPVTYTRCLATPALADLENNGMYLDKEKVASLCAQKEREYHDVVARLADVTGGINTNSTLQLREFLYETLGFDELRDRRGNELKTGSGLAKTDQVTISKLKCRTKAQREFLTLYVQSKELYNELTKYLRKFDECGEVVDGWLRAQFNQTNTRTHRLSSSGLDYNTQFQNFPRAYKPLFTSRNKGWLVGEADGAQLEFRVAAHLGRDEVALDDIKQGTDIHSVTADIIGVTRQGAKAHTFKPLYGGRSGSPNEVRYYEFFREKYSGITATQQSWINEVLSTGELETEWGLRYYWPDTEMQRSGYVTNSTSICNYPVQAFATAEIIPIGLVYFWHYLKKSDLKMLIVNTVHDSIITELPPEEREDFAALSYRAMVEDTYSYIYRVYGIKLIVPLAAGVATGTHWGNSEAKENEAVYTATEDLYG